ncbi:MAG TPA: D-Ala-D-Ala carboxypeptidase family metallohydrolase, partial [Pyrinomonadaceae bacterium]
TYGNSGYYNTEVTSFLVDSDYNLLASNTANADLQAILLLFANGRGCDEYTILSSHRTTTQYYVTAFPYDGGYRDGYYDVFDYLFSSEQGQVEDYVSSMFFSALTNPRVLDQPVINLGSTEYTSSGNCAPPCGDERDTIIREYRTHGVALKPACPDFTQTRGSERFPFSVLNTGDYSWALIREPLTIYFTDYGLAQWDFESVGLQMNVNSAYRNPSRNSRVGGATASRHMYGDAADIKNETRSRDEYDRRAAAAQRANADYIEPWTGPCGNGCTHADWRSHTGGY